MIVRGNAYAYPRYFFDNKSLDILAVMGCAPDVAGVQWRYSRPTTISITRRVAVAQMELHIGPMT